MRKPQMVTDRELDILKVLWTTGPASVRQVQEALNAADPDNPVAYSTVQTLLGIMEERKGLVVHEIEGRTFLYRPKRPAEWTMIEMTRRFVDRVFDGSLDQLMVTLVHGHSLSPKELARLHEVLDQAHGQKEAEPGPGAKRTGKSRDNRTAPNEEDPEPSGDGHRNGTVRTSPTTRRRSPIRSRAASSGRNGKLR